MYEAPRGTPIPYLSELNAQRGNILNDVHDAINGKDPTHHAHFSPSKGVSNETPWDHLVDKTEHIERGAFLVDEKGAVKEYVETIKKSTYPPEGLGSHPNSSLTKPPLAAGEEAAEVSKITVKGDWVSRFLKEEKWFGKKGAAFAGGTALIGATIYGAWHLMHKKEAESLDQPPQR